MSQPSRQCCGEKEVKALTWGWAPPKSHGTPWRRKLPQGRSCVYPLGLPFPNPADPGPGANPEGAGKAADTDEHFLLGSAPRPDWYRLPQLPHLTTQA